MFHHWCKLVVLAALLVVVASCKTLAENPAPIGRDKQGYTPLHRAVLEGNLTAIIALLKAGADPNALNKSGNTPLYLAVLYNTPPPHNRYFTQGRGGSECTW